METGKRRVLAESAESDIAGVLYHPSTHALQAFATMWTRTAWHAVDASIAPCLLYTSDAADERSSVDLGGRRLIKKKNNIKKKTQKKKKTTNNKKKNKY